jgi:hypothetical protein
MTSTFCVIHPSRAWVNLAFSRGTDLADPQGLLEGTGKRIRHVKAHAAPDARTATVRALVRQAARLAVSQSSLRPRR